MGTRGFFYTGKFYLFYNHSDSYPSGLGKTILHQLLIAIKQSLLQQWKQKVLELKTVDSKISPTNQEVSKLVQYTNLDVSTGSSNDWYCLLRKCQGSLIKSLESGFIMNHVDDDGEPIYEEYGYVINFDQDTFDFYVGVVKVESWKLDDPSLLNDEIFNY